MSTLPPTPPPTPPLAPLPPSAHVPAPGPAPSHPPPYRGVGLGALLWLLTAAALVGYLLARGLARSSGPEPQVLVNELKRIAKLATVEAREAEILRVDDSVPVLVFFESRKEAVILARGRVLAGVDLEKAVFDVRDDAGGRRVEVRLPPAEVLSVESEIEFYSESNGWLAPIEASDRNQWMALARLSLRKAAIRAGIRERAALHARELIEGFARGLGYRAVFLGGEEGVATPEPPSGPEVIAPGR